MRGQARCWVGVPALSLVLSICWGTGSPRPAWAQSELGRGAGGEGVVSVRFVVVPGPSGVLRQ